MAQIVWDMARNYTADYSVSEFKFVTPKILQATGLIKQLIIYGRIAKTPLQEQKGDILASR